MVAVKNNTVILIVSGASSLPGYYERLIGTVNSCGYTINALHLPSVGESSGTGRPGPLPTMYDDAEFIAVELGKLADQGKDIVVICHSYSGTPGTESIKGLTKAQRIADRKAGGVVRLAYMTCLVPEIGKSAASVLAGAPPENTIQFRVNEEGWLIHKDIERSARIVFFSLPLAEGEEWIRDFPLQSSAVFAGELTHAGYKDVPILYLVVEEDLCIPCSTQLSEINIIEKVSGQKVDVTRVKADHILNVTATKEVANWLVGVMKIVETAA